MLRKKIDEKRKALNALLEKDAEFEARSAEIEQSIEEAETEEEQGVVEEAVEGFEAEKAAHDEEKKKLEGEISEMEEELKAEEEENEAQGEPAAEVPEAAERKREIKMENRTKFFDMSIQERDAMFARDDVQAFLGEVRACIKEKRALTGVGALIPEVFLGLLRQNIESYSKLYKHVNVRRIGGDGRAAIMGEYEEAIWTDCCANLNEMNLAFYEVELNCWRVGGYYAICNATLEDSDIDLAAELLRAIGQGIGIAVDKAIIYGLGTRMPLGFVTRLAQTEEPSGYPQAARPWVDLHTTNIQTIGASATGVDFFKALALATGAAKGAYSRGAKVWAMNETTYTKLMAEAMSINAAGGIVTGINGSMPVSGGVIEVLNFIPDDNIAGGFLDLYTLAERAGQKFASSEHVRFLQDQTVFKGTARYDGTPVIAEGFVLLGIGGTTPTTSVEFAPDSANDGTGA